VLVAAAGVVLTDLQGAQTMPLDSGYLQNQATYVDESGLGDDVVSIVSDTVYARRKFFNPQFNFNRTVNSRAGGRWFDEYTVGAKRGMVRNAFVGAARSRPL